MVLEVDVAGVPLLALIGSLVVIVLLVLCVCGRANKDSVSSPIASLQEKFRVITNQSATVHHRNGNLSYPSSDVEAADNQGKVKVPTLQRRLPDIPVLPVQLSDDQTDPTINSQSPDTGSELYATVESTVPRNSSMSQSAIAGNGEVCRQDVVSNVTTSPSTSGFRRSEGVSPVMASVVSALKEGRDATPSSGDSEFENPYAQVQQHKYTKVKREHPYDWLKGQASEERDTDTDNYDDPQVYAQTTASVHRDWSAGDAAAATYEPPPPVPEKRFDLTDSVESLPQPALTLTAANAMSGRVPTSEIPYVTSPLDSPTAHASFVERASAAAAVPQPDLVYNISQNSDSGGQDVRYTSISVREPLANLRPQLSSLLTRSEPESYYSVVCDDDQDQTYAEIRSGQVSGNSSVTYARIEPPGMNELRELPPVPPPVESLRSLASVHSRQASSSSTLSGQVGTSSPETESRQNSCLGSNTFLSSPHSDKSDLYSTVDKSKLADRRTIHVTEPQSLQGLNLEEMYAKVLKNKRLSLRQDVAEPPSSINTGAKPKAATHPPMVPLPELPVSSFDKPHLSTFSDPRRPKSMIGYSDHEKHSEFHTSSSNSSDNLTSRHIGTTSNDPGYEKVVHDSSKLDVQLNKLASHDPGYESIEKNSNYDTDPGYETVQGILNPDPGYESVLENKPVHQAEPGYETVQSVDPGYEQIKQQYMHEEPGYESVNQEQGHPKRELSPAFYEAFGASYADPDYEIVNFENYLCSSQSSLCNPGYEKVKAPYADEDEESSDPAYERVNFVTANVPDPDYETVGEVLLSVVQNTSSVETRQVDSYVQIEADSIPSVLMGIVLSGGDAAPESLDSANYQSFIDTCSERSTISSLVSDDYSSTSTTENQVRTECTVLEKSLFGCGANGGCEDKPVEEDGIGAVCDVHHQNYTFRNTDNSVVIRVPLSASSIAQEYSVPENCNSVQSIGNDNSRQSGMADVCVVSELVTASDKVKE